MTRKMMLDDAFPGNFSIMKKTALGVGLIEPKTTIDYLAIKMHYENKRAKVELTSGNKIHEEISPIDSGLLKHTIRKAEKIRHWKEGQIEETYEKLYKREIEVSDNAKK